MHPEKESILFNMRIFCYNGYIINFLLNFPSKIDSSISFKKANSNENV